LLHSESQIDSTQSLGQKMNASLLSTSSTMTPKSSAPPSPLSGQKPGAGPTPDAATTPAQRMTPRRLIRPASPIDRHPEPEPPCTFANSDPSCMAAARTVERKPPAASSTAGGRVGTAALDDMRSLGGAPVSELRARASSYAAPGLPPYGGAQTTVSARLGGASVMRLDNGAQQRPHSSQLLYKQIGGAMAVVRPTPQVPLPARAPTLPGQPLLGSPVAGVLTGPRLTSPAMHPGSASGFGGVPLRSRAVTTSAVVHVRRGPALSAP